MRIFIYRVSSLVIILGLGFFGSYLILDKARVVSLRSDNINVAVENSLQLSSSGSYIPIAGKDYAIKHIQYFDNKNWAVVSISPIGTFSDSALIVLEKQGSGYKLVLGPGNSFKGSDLSSLPSDVAKYINP